MEIIAVVDDYVIGFVVRAQRVAEYEEELDDDTVAEWMEAAFGHLRSQIESGAFPHLHACDRRPTAPRAARTRISGEMASSEGRFERGLELPARRHRGEVRQAGQAASWKMTPSVVRRPERTVATPWRMVAR